MNTRIFTKKGEHNGNDTGIQIFLCRKRKRGTINLYKFYSMKIVSYTSARKNLKSLFDNACDDSSVIFLSNAVMEKESSFFRKKSIPHSTKQHIFSQIQK